MKSFWGRGAIAVSALLAVVAFGSFLAGENLTKVGAYHASPAQQQPAGTAVAPGQATPASGAPSRQPWPGRGPRHAHHGNPRGGFPGPGRGDVEEP